VAAKRILANRRRSSLDELEIRIPFTQQQLGCRLRHDGEVSCFAGGYYSGELPLTPHPGAE